MRTLLQSYRFIVSLTALVFVAVLFLGLLPSRVSIIKGLRLFNPSDGTPNQTWLTPGETSIRSPIRLLILEDDQISSQLLMQVVAELSAAQLTDQNGQRHLRYHIQMHPPQASAADAAKLLQEQNFDFLLMGSLTLLQSLQPALLAADLHAKVVMFDHELHDSVAEQIDANQIIQAEPRISKSIELAMQTFPDLEHLFLIGNSVEATAESAIWHRQVQEAANTHQLQFVSLLDKSADQIISGIPEPDRVHSLIVAASLPPGDAPEAQLQTLSRTLPGIPIICCDPQFLRFGAVASFSVNATHLAERLDQYLTGSKFAVTDQEVPHSLFLQGPLLSRLLGYSLRELPAQSVLLGHVPLFYSDSKELVLYDFFPVLVVACSVITTFLFFLQRSYLANQRLTLQAATTHFSKITTLGYYNAALGHQLSQPLGAMFNNIDAMRCMLMLGTAPPAQETKQIIEDLLSDHRRIQDVVNSIRSLARRSPGIDLESVSAFDLCEQTISKLKDQELFNRMNWRLLTAAALPRINASRSLLEQALINVLTNAGEATLALLTRESSDQMLPPSYKGSITVSLSKHQEPSGVTGVLIRVTDDGVPFPEEYLSSSTPAQYSNKENGMGMGLQIARMILDEQDGWLRVEQDSAGKQVMMWVPATDESSDTRQSKD